MAECAYCGGSILDKREMVVMIQPKGKKIKYPMYHKKCWSIVEVTRLS